MGNVTRALCRIPLAVVALVVCAAAPAAADDPNIIITADNLSPAKGGTVRVYLTYTGLTPSTWGYKLAAVSQPGVEKGGWPISYYASNVQTSTTATGNDTAREYYFIAPNEDCTLLLQCKPIGSLAGDPSNYLWLHVGTGGDGEWDLGEEGGTGGDGEEEPPVGDGGILNGLGDLLRYLFVPKEQVLKDFWTALSEFMAWGPFGFGQQIVALASVEPQATPLEIPVPQVNVSAPHGASIWSDNGTRQPINLAFFTDMPAYQFLRMIMGAAVYVAFAFLVLKVITPRQVS